jgi:hypothetical protein
MQGYDKGYKACFSSNGTGDDNKIHSQSDTGGTFVPCNKSQHSIEYCNGYRAGAVDSDVNDDPDGNISPSKVTCQGGTSVQNTAMGINKAMLMRTMRCFPLR